MYWHKAAQSYRQSGKCRWQVAIFLLFWWQNGKQELTCCKYENSCCCIFFVKAWFKDEFTAEQSRIYTSLIGCIQIWCRDYFQSWQFQLTVITLAGDSSDSLCASAWRTLGRYRLQQMPARVRQRRRTAFSEAARSRGTRRRPIVTLQCLRFIHDFVQV